MGRLFPNGPVVALTLLSLALAGCGSVRAGDGSQPVRPASTFIPSGVRVVAVTAVPGMNDRTKPPAPVTMTDAARVRKLVALVNAQPLFPPGVFNCPADDGRGVRLTFLAGPGGPTVATAFAKSNGCGGVDLTIGKRRVGLGWGSAVAEQALAISGMN